MRVNRILQFTIVSFALFEVVIGASATGSPVQAGVELKTALTDGVTSRWQVSIRHIHIVNVIPGTKWTNSVFHFVVAEISATNLGRQSADLYDDVDLVIRAPNKVGWRPLDRTQPSFAAMARAAVTHYGGTIPWQATKPGHTTTYTYVFGALRTQVHFGLYRFDASRGYIFLLDTGL